MMKSCLGDQIWTETWIGGDLEKTEETEQHTRWSFDIEDELQYCNHRFKLKKLQGWIQGEKSVASLSACDSLLDAKCCFLYQSMCLHASL